MIVLTTAALPGMAHAMNGTSQQQCPGKLGTMVLTTAALPGTAHAMTGIKRIGTALTSTALPGTPKTRTCTTQATAPLPAMAQARVGTTITTSALLGTTHTRMGAIGTQTPHGKRQNQSSLGARAKRRESREPKMQKYYMDQAETLKEETEKEIAKMNAGADIEIQKLVEQTQADIDQMEKELDSQMQ